MNRKLKRIFMIFLCAAAVLASAVLIINASVKSSVKERIAETKENVMIKDADCILVLGCRVDENGNPSDMLKDRLDRAIELYKQGAAPKLLMSGDHGRENYDEVNVMKNYAVSAGVPPEDVFMDHAGFSTYESLYRAREVFCADSVIVVTQKYHLYRALYIADKLGVDACGAAGDYHMYRGTVYNECREILARNKDFFKTIIKPEPTFLGEKIPVSGDGNLTND